MFPKALLVTGYTNPWSVSILPTLGLSQYYLINYFVILSNLLMQIDYFKFINYIMTVTLQVTNSLPQGRLEVWLRARVHAQQA